MKRIVESQGSWQTESPIPLHTRSLIESNPVTNRFELEIELRQWANTIRNGLEFLLDVPILPAGN